jgi:radical SAM-linked protein
MIRVDPVKDLGKLLLSVEKPGRYVGGEYGCLASPPDREGILRTLIAFPDLYEIGMSNQAFRIIYRGLNALEGVTCDRAFAPAPDFEGLLRNRGLPLYGLDTGISFRELDILCFTLGYELGITGVLAMLDVSSIPLHAAEREEGDPIVLAGGPCVSNPAPYGTFFDAFWIGEAEAGFFTLVKKLGEMKRAGEGRGALLEEIGSHPSVWYMGKGRTFRAMDTDFSSRKADAAVFPVPSMKVVQHHGALEIMRGCPNGCRFCHAGFWYRPMRQKRADTVAALADDFIRKGGYREISLSSLSTGDYRHIDSLMETLNKRYASLNVSFQLPSIRVSSFSLPLLEKISGVRKSGLTFAVETPLEAWQLAINKEVSLDNVTAILREAKKRGWRKVKFYFMIGLPPAGDSPPAGIPPGEEGRRHNEEAGIVDFITVLGKRTGMHFNLNVGVFVPKPHTPYQWAAQMDEDEARRKLEYIRSRLKPLGHRVSFNDPLTALVEGFLSRGGEDAAVIIEEAYRRGCRLDAWDDYMKKEVWRELLGPRRAGILGERDMVRELPWDMIYGGTENEYFRRELAKSKGKEITLPCTEFCNHNCGVCERDCKIVINNIHVDNLHDAANAGGGPEPERPKEETDKGGNRPPSGFLTFRLLFSFSKRENALFYSHLTMLEVFSMAMIRAGIPVSFTRGFNPQPRMEFASPLAMGIEARGEIAMIETGELVEGKQFVHCMNDSLPRGVHIIGAENYTIEAGQKKHSLSSLLWGFSYRLAGGNEEFVPAAAEKKFRTEHYPDTAVNTAVKDDFPVRLSVLAKDPEDHSGHGSYFDTYRTMYPL